MTVSTRPETSEDEPFVRQLVLATVAQELGAALWPDAVRGPLLEIQYSSRRKSIRDSYPGASSAIVSVDGQDAGWLVVADLEDEIRLVEIMIDGGHQRQGIGSGLAKGILARAGKPVRLTVSATNTGALHLYERLGFRRTGGNQVRHYMEYP
jgi:ribosomal protein S18 acetylase RimI-like enzyme